MVSAGGSNLGYGKARPDAKARSRAHGFACGSALRPASGISQRSWWKSCRHRALKSSKYYRILTDVLEASHAAGTQGRQHTSTSPRTWKKATGDIRKESPRMVSEKVASLNNPERQREAERRRRRMMAKPKGECTHPRVQVQAGANTLKAALHSNTHKRHAVARGKQAGTHMPEAGKSNAHAHAHTQTRVGWSYRHAPCCPPRCAPGKKAR